MWGVLTQRVAEILLQHHDVLMQQAEQIKQDRTWLYGRLVGTVDVRAYPSEANFILFHVAHAARVFDGAETTRRINQEYECRTHRLDRLFACYGRHDGRERIVRPGVAGKVFMNLKNKLLVTNRTNHA